MENLKEKTLGEIVSQSTAAAGVFEKYHLDFCCKGKRPLKDACASQGIDLERVTTDLEAALASTDGASDDHLQQMQLDELANYIVNKHHAYVRHAIPLITAHTAKVVERHGNHEPNLKKIAELWQSVAAEMTAHMAKEEQVLFPVIKRLAAADATKNAALFPSQPFVSKPIQVMEMEHDQAGELMEQIRQLSNGYTPALACTTYRLIFNELREFEEDLHRHVHLENHLLFPKAIKLEEKLLQPEPGACCVCVI